MEKVKYSYDKETATFYIVFGIIAKGTLNVSLDEDVLLRFDLKKKKATGLTITNFDLRFPKLKKLIGSKNEDLIPEYFDMFLKNINNLVIPLVSSAKERRVFKKLIDIRSDERVLA